MIGRSAPPVHPGALQLARAAISGLVCRTPVIHSEPLTSLVGAPVTLKLENLQVTGAFKARGAANKLLALSDDERKRGVITCSSGNHGRAVAYVARRLGVAATVCVPEWVDPLKLEAIRQQGATAVAEGTTYDEAEARSIEIARDRELTYVSPFDDPFVIAGQGTIGLEIADQVPDVDTVVVPLSGGGLIGGIALALKSLRPEVRIIGVSAANARVMFESLKAGHPVTLPEEHTVASALSGGIGLDNRYSFTLVRDYVDDHILVSEDEIRAAMRHAVKEEKIVVEGGGAVALAALLAGKLSRPGRHNTVVVSGGNVDLGLLTEVMNEAGSTNQ